MTTDNDKRDLNELLRLPYSEMTEDEIEEVVEYRNQVAFNNGVFQGTMRAYREFLGEDSKEYHKAADEYLKKLNGKVDDAR